MGLLDTTMEVAKLAGKFANPELVQEAMKANVEALAMARENLELQKKVTELETRITAQEAQKDLVNKVYLNGGYVFRDGDPNPHCQKCWDADRKLIHLHFVPLVGRQCPDCKTKYHGDCPGNTTRIDAGSIDAW